MATTVLTGIKSAAVKSAADTSDFGRALVAEFLYEPQIQFSSLIRLHQTFGITQDVQQLGNLVENLLAFSKHTFSLSRPVNFCGRIAPESTEPRGFRDSNVLHADQTEAPDHPGGNASDPLFPTSARTEPERRASDIKRSFASAPR